MGDDVMGSSLDMPAWPKIKDRTRLYNRKISYLSGDNKITERSFDCKIQKKKERESITVWGLKFRVIKFEETCNTDNLEIKNFYYLDNQNIVRKSLQYHSETIGYLSLERLDR